MLGLRHVAELAPDPIDQEIDVAVILLRSRLGDRNEDLAARQNAARGTVEEGECPALKTRELDDGAVLKHRSRKVGLEPNIAVRGVVVHRASVETLAAQEAAGSTCSITHRPCPAPVHGAEAPPRKTRGASVAPQFGSDPRVQGCFADPGAGNEEHHVGTERKQLGKDEAQRT